MVYYGGDSGLFISITKHMLNGGSADFISVEERWRFGSAAFLGLPAIAAYLSEASGLSPENPIPYETAVSIIFVIIGAIVYAEFIGRNASERSAIMFVYVFLQPAIYYAELNVLRSFSVLLLILPFILPLFVQLRFNTYGKMSFIASIFSLIIIHPLSLVIIAVMLSKFWKAINSKEKIGLVSLFLLFGLIVVFSPSIIRALSISPEALPEFTFKDTLLEQLIAPFPTFDSSAWPAAFVQKVSILITILLALSMALYKGFPLPKSPVIGFLVVFFILAFVIETDNFPIIRLSMFLSGLGILVFATIMIREYQIVSRIIGRLKYLQSPFVAQSAIIWKVAIFSGIAFLVIVCSYPRDRSLMLDAYSASEYQFLKDFVNKENQNFNNSLIFSHIETLRYLNGIEGSILYYNDAPKAFSIDFIDRPIATEHYGAFSAMLSGDSSKARIWMDEHNVTSAYVVVMYRFVPSGATFQEGELVLQNEVGMIRKVYLEDLLDA
jgi:hypothetical protein